MDTTPLHIAFAQIGARLRVVPMGIGPAELLERPAAAMSVRRDRIGPYFELVIDRLRVGDIEASKIDPDTHRLTLAHQ